MILTKFLSSNWYQAGSRVNLKPARIPILVWVRNESIETIGCRPPCPIPGKKKSGSGQHKNHQNL